MKSSLKKLSLLFIICLLSNCTSKKQIVYQPLDISKKTYTYKKTENGTKLKLDLYTSTKLKNDAPLIIHVHGGGFSGGSRDENHIKEFCTEMAKNGFITASISYRLTMKNYGFGCNTKSSLKIDAFNSASEDISYATKYLIDNKKRFKINNKKIILIGSSAGAEAALNLVYVYNNKILPKDFKYAGVIAMAGAITSLNGIKTKSAIPTQLFHGDKDKLVPFDIAPHHYCDKNSDGYLILYGSKAIANKLKEINASYYLYTIENGNHSWSSKPMYLCKKEIFDFIYNYVLKNSKNKEIIVKKKSLKI